MAVNTAIQPLWVSPWAMLKSGVTSNTSRMIFQDVPEQDKGDQRAKGGEHPRGIGKVPMSSGIFHQPRQIGLLIHENTSFMKLLVSNS